MIEKLDPVTVAILLAGTVLGPDLAHVIGPYAAILLASSTGAAWALGRRDPLHGWTSVVWYFSRINFTSLILTVPLTFLLIRTFGLEWANWMLVPVGLLIGGIGDDWPQVGKWVVSRLGRLIERRAGIDNRSE